MSPVTRAPARRTARRLAALVVGVSLLAAACGDDDDDTADAAAETTETTASGADADAGDGEAVEVRAVDFAFEGLPDVVPAGTQLTLVNEATSEMHELVAIRLPDGEDRSLEELLALPEEEIDALLGGAPPATVLLTAPGGEQIAAVGDGTLSEPGRYVVICAIPTGVDPDEFLAAAAESGGGPPEIENAGPPHFVHGMAADLTVE